MKEVIHNVMGAEYTILFGDKEEIGLAKENMGECRVYSKRILVCTEVDDCTEEELEMRTREILAHEIFHAYLNEAGIEIEEDGEELLASFYMKNWEKMTNSIKEVYRNT